LLAAFDITTNLQWTRAREYMAGFHKPWTGVIEKLDRG
jgi:hypothetical protein